MFDERCLQPDAAADCDVPPVNEVSGMYEATLELAPWTAHEFWVDNLGEIQGGGPADPVMHLIDLESDMVLGSNDDCTSPPGGIELDPLAACLTVGNSTPKPRIVRLVVHAGSGQATGDVFHSVDGVTAMIGEHRRFGGHILGSQENVGWSSQDLIQAVRVTADGVPPDAPLSVYALEYWPDGAGLSLVGWHNPANDEPPIAGGGYTRIKDWTNPLLAGEKVVIVGSAVGSVSGRAVRLYINDRDEADSDNDGLGDRLELELGTCPFPSSDCSEHTVNPADTDHDGLCDGWELLGVDLPEDLDEPLPTYGSDPRHKDVFVEVHRRSDAVLLTEEEAEFIAWAFGSGREGRAKNPDGAPGIAVHLDMGIDSCNSQGTDCDERYGDWGGSGVDDQSDPKNTWSYFNFAWEFQELSWRRGIYRYALLKAKGGGQASSWTFEVGGKPVASVRGVAFAHELGHSHGVTHGGPSLYPPCKPNYLSIMNYAFSYDMDVGFSSGARPSLKAMELDEGMDYVVEPLDLEKLGHYDFDQWSASSGELVGIDWNRNYSQDPGTVEGRPIHSPKYSCGNSYFFHSTERTKQPAMVGVRGARPPAIVSLGSSAVLFAADGTDSTKIRAARFNSDLSPCSDGWAPGCCSLDSPQLGKGCGATWEPLSAANISEDAAILAGPFAAADDESRWLVYLVSSPPDERVVFREVLPTGHSEIVGSVDVQVGGYTADLHLAVAQSADYLYVYFVGADFYVQRLSWNHVSGEGSISGVDYISDAGELLPLQSKGRLAVSHSDDWGTFLTRFWEKSNGQYVRRVLHAGAPDQTFDLLAELHSELPNGHQAISEGLTLFINELSPVPTLEVYRTDSLGRTLVSWANLGPDVETMRLRHASLFAKMEELHSGVALGVHNGQLQLVATRGAGGASDAAVHHWPFALARLNFELADNDDFGLMHDKMCGLLRGKRWPTGRCAMLREAVLSISLILTLHTGCTTDRATPGGGPMPDALQFDSRAEAEASPDGGEGSVDVVTEVPSPDEGPVPEDGSETGDVGAETDSDAELDTESPVFPAAYEPTGELWHFDAPADGFPLNRAAVASEMLFYCHRTIDDDSPEGFHDHVMAVWYDSIWDGYEAGQYGWGSQSLDHWTPTLATTDSYVPYTHNYREDAEVPGFGWIIGTWQYADPQWPEWSFGIPGPASEIQSQALALDGDDTLYVASRTTLYAIDDVGEEVWSVAHGWALPECIERPCYDLSPTVSGDTVYLVAGGDVSEVKAFSTVDGAAGWTVEIPEGYMGLPPAMLPTGELLINGGVLGVLALTPEGEVAWEYQYAGFPAPNPLTVTPEGLVLVTHSTGTPLVAVMGGDQLWGYADAQTLEGPSQPMHVTDKGLLVTAMEIDGEPVLLGLDFEGERVFEKPLPEGTELAEAPLAIVGDDLVVIPVATGQLAVRVPVGAPASSWSTVDGDMRRSRGKP